MYADSLGGRTYLSKYQMLDQREEGENMWVPSHMFQKPVFILLQTLAEQSSNWLEKKRNKNKK